MATFPSNPTVIHQTPRSRKENRLEEALAVAAAVIAAMDRVEPPENAWSRAGREEIMASRQIWSKQ